jgi:ribosomal protein L37E
VEKLAEDIFQDTCKKCGSQAKLNNEKLCETCAGLGRNDSVKRIMESSWTKVVAALLMVSLSSCSHRVLVKDCQDIKDSSFKNCEFIKKL